MNDKYLGKATILKNSPVGQDFSSFSWLNSHVLFYVYELNKDKVACEAYGYGLVGSKESYGNGCIYVNKKYLYWIEKVIRYNNIVRLENVGGMKGGGIMPSIEFQVYCGICGKGVCRNTEVAWTSITVSCPDCEEEITALRERVKELEYELAEKEGL